MLHSTRVSDRRNDRIVKALTSYLYAAITLSIELLIGKRILQNRKGFLQP